MSEIFLPNKINSKGTNSSANKIKKEIQEQKQKILHIIHKYLTDQKLQSVAETLQNEAQMGDQYEVCDNIDLDIILQEYESYYFMKFKKYPKILRQRENVNPIAKHSATKIRPKSNKNDNITLINENNFQFDIVQLGKTNEEPLKPLCDFENYSTEWREMADQILQQVVPKSLNVTWQDCIGLSETAELLKEAILYPIRYPELFRNVCTWSGILLYGPPGTGKTLLAKALACESSSMFINVTSSTFVSKWRGESEKMLKVLFDVAKFYAPVTIFVDEIDALASTTTDAHHEASRRFKSELLTQIDGILQSDKVFVLATTNSPWMLDRALIRRFEKRIFVPLPDEITRRQIVRKYIDNLDHTLTGSDLTAIAKCTENFSGSDIKVICKEVEMVQIRDRILNIRNGKKDAVVKRITVQEVLQAKDKIKPCIEGDYYQKYLQWNVKFGAM